MPAAAAGGRKMPEAVTAGHPRWAMREWWSRPAMGVLLLYKAIVDGVVSRSGYEAIDVFVACDLFRALEHDHEWPVLLQHELEIEIHLLALLGIALPRRRICLFGDLRDIPGIAPGERFRLCVIGVVGIAREAVGVRMRVHVIRGPVEQQHLVLPRAIFGNDLLLLARDDLRLYTGLAQGCLHRLSHVGEGRAVGRIELDFEAVRVAGFGQKLLAFGDVEMERRVCQGSKEARRPKGLMHLEAALEKSVRHSLIIDEPSNGFADFRLGQTLVFLIESQIV